MPVVLVHAVGQATDVPATAAGDIVDIEELGVAEMAAHETFTVVGGHGQSHLLHGMDSRVVGLALSSVGATGLIEQFFTNHGVAAPGAFQVGAFHAPLMGNLVPATRTDAETARPEAASSIATHAATTAPSAAASAAIAHSPSASSGHHVSFR